TRVEMKTGQAATWLLLVLTVFSAVAAGGCHRRGAEPFAGVRNPDVILITLDTLRYDALGFSGNTRVKTPNLDRLAGEGVVFLHAHAHNVFTLPSHVNILTGLYPYQHGVRSNLGFRLATTTPTLATWLRSRGYATGAFIGAFPLDARFGLSRGFDVYDQHYPQGANEYSFVMAERPAGEVVASARNWLNSVHGRPRFLWVHLYDCHSPYRPPPPFDRVYADDPYLGEVAGVDAALGPLLADLRAAPGPLLLVLTADHGEALGDHGEKTHGLFAYEATLHVPLLLWSPGILRPAVEKRLARHIDIVPTVLEAVGLPAPKTLPGLSLLRPPPSDEVSYFEALTASLERGWAPLRGSIGRRYKFIDLPVPELYDLSTDPEEKRNLAGERTDIVRRLKIGIPTEAAPPSPAAASAEEIGRLRSLGYLSGGVAPRTQFGPRDDPKNLVDLDRDLQRVVDFYQARQLREAIELAARIVDRRPTMATGYEFLSLLQAEIGDDAAAIRTLEDANRRDLLAENLKSRLGLLYSENGRHREALSVLEPLARTQNPDVLNALGVVRAGAGRVPEALEAFHRALEVDPGNAIAYQNIGITELHRGNFSAALAAFDSAFAINDRLPRAWNGRGVALQQSGRPQEAILAWKRAVELDPEQFDALFNLGVVALERGDSELARSSLSQFVERAPVGRFGPDIARARAMLGRLSGTGKRSAR
ncbi:MAG TPA: sulfatase-like hydrolase/transferase, partial [Thermoanaerobaculia bacterium]|nr:sulfatase-like hydrolase/transferase [Thermoanaerobaculia bacterium]